LKSGGSIVINPTEALVAIDVNSGRCTSQKELEETALKSNLEAAQEVARQLRLRDLGGLVVIDFIDMRDKKHQKEVEAALNKSLKTDKARVSVGHLSKFGLLELSRQRLRPTAEASVYNPCPICQGRGRLKTVPSLGLSLLRQISVQVAQNPIQEVRALVPLEVGNFLLNQKRREILALEEQYHLRIVLTSSVGLSPEEIQLEFIKREAEEPKREAPEAKREVAEAKREVAEPKREAPEAKREVAEIKPETPEAKPEPRKSRRGHRRGPRRGAKRAPKDGTTEGPTPEPGYSGEPAAPAPPAAQPASVTMAAAPAEPAESTEPAKPKADVHPE